ncbi:hypothetical protein [Mucilaginibacter sp. MD40]|nr:hypothetical protein [Mucilaginibacter sp. MD40]
MKKAINTILSDFNHVFVKGQSSKTEQARVFALLIFPTMIALFGIGRFPF